MANSKITIDMQIQAANRELGLRHAVYPKRVGNGLMSQEEANYEIDVQRAILETLREVKNKQRICRFLGKPFWAKRSKTRRLSVRRDVQARVGFGGDKSGLGGIMVNQIRKGTKVIVYRHGLGRSRSYSAIVEEVRRDKLNRVEYHVNIDDGQGLAWFNRKVITLPCYVKRLNKQ